MNLRSHKLKFLKRLWPWVALVIVISLIFAVKFVVLNKHLWPPSSDMGNHLSILHAFHGNDVTGYNLKYRYPPLYFLLVLDPLTKLLPVFTALKVSAALVSTIIAVPFFLLVRKVTGSNAVALFTAGLYAFNEGYSSMMCWGAIPNFLGIFFMLWSAYYIVDAVKKGSRRSAVLAGLFLSLTVGTHHLTAPYYVLALFLSALFLLAVKKMKALSAIKLLVLVIITGALLSLPYVPTYIVILSNSSVFAKSNAGVAQVININVIKTEVEFLFRSLIPVVWIIVTAVGVFGLWKGVRDKFIFIFILGLSLSSLILIFILGTVSRPLQFLYIPIHLAFSGFFLIIWKELAKAIPGKKLPHALLSFTLIAIVTSSLLVGSYARLVAAVDSYHVMKEEIVEALDWLRKNTEPNDITITNDKRLAWWVEGYALRKCYMSAKIVASPYKDQWHEIDTANKIMAGNYVIDNGYLRVADFFPAGFHNPKISMNLGNRYVDLVHFNETDITLNDTDTTLYSKPKAIQLNVTEDKAIITYTYAGNYAIITRIVEVTHAPQVTITYNVTLINSKFLLKGVDQTIGVSPDVKVESNSSVYSASYVRVNLTLRDVYGKTTNVKITLLETNGEIVNPPKVFLPSRSLPYSRFAINAIGLNLYMKFLVSVGPKIPEQSTIEYFNAYELLKTHDINYIVLNKENHFRRDVYRFTYDSQFFEPVRETGDKSSGILVLKVVDDEE